MKCRWQLPPPSDGRAAALVTALGCGPVVASILVQRGFEDPTVAAAFLAPRLQALGDPYELPDMGRAVGRLQEARAKAEPVVLFGDYDVDGVSATAILVEVLGALGWRVEHYLPDRFTEGYGLGPESVQRCLKQHPARLLVAVDCGSSSAGVIGDLAREGVDTIVLDHHQLGDPIPAALALVNPRRLTDPERHPAGQLCSAGVAFKLAHAIVKEGRREGLRAETNLDLKGWLDLVALGTVADLVPMVGENRILVSSGLDRLARRERVGLRALMEVCGVKDEPGVFELGYQLGPRLNAAGRLETARTALDMLLEREDARALALARQLDGCNRERQSIEAAVAEQALERVRSRFDPARDLVLVEGDHDWHIGVVGIVASRLVREFHRPTLVLGGDGEAWRGSGRSIDGFDLAGALRSCSDLLLRHGGHAMAAGVSAPAGPLDKLRDRLNEVARRDLDPARLQRVLRVDAELELRELDLRLLESLQSLEPFGQGNPPVQVLVRSVNCVDRGRQMGQGGRHRRFTVGSGAARADVVWWGAGDAEVPGGVFDLLVQPQINEFQGRRRVQLRLLDWSPSA